MNKNKKDIKNKKEDTKVKKEPLKKGDVPVFETPQHTKRGRIVIWFLIVAMVLGFLIGIIYAIVDAIIKAGY